MNAVMTLDFDRPQVHEPLDGLDGNEVDALGFGVIAFDEALIVTRYNAFESRMAGLSTTSVLGKHFFHVVAPCMNNALVRGRFDDAVARQTVLDVAIDYVLTLRMQPTPVTLRLLFSPDRETRYVLVDRRS